MIAFLLVLSGTVLPIKGHTSSHSGANGSQKYRFVSFLPHRSQSVGITKVPAPELNWTVDFFTASI